MTMSWVSGTNSFEYGHGGYGYGSSRYDVGDVHNYEFNSSLYGETYGVVAPQHAGDSCSTFITPQRYVDYDYGCEAERPTNCTNHFDSLSRIAVDPPTYDRNQRYKREPTYKPYNNYADQPSYSSRYNDYDEKPYYADRFKSYDEESEFLFRTASITYNFNALETNPVTESAFTADAEVTEVSEEVLVNICGAVGYLVDDRESPLPGEGDFLRVLIKQAGNSIIYSIICY